MLPFQLRSFSQDETVLLLRRRKFSAAQILIASRLKFVLFGRSILSLIQKIQNIYPGYHLNFEALVGTQGSGNGSF